MRKPEIPDKILTHEDVSPIPYTGFVRGLAARKSMHAPAQDGVTAGEPVKARVDWGRWIVDCPDCNGAAMVSDKEKVYWCLSCGNASIKFAWREVKFPRSRKSIESALMKRPAAMPQNAQTRNWKHGETVAHLKKVNKENGV
jgi:hypothetical protein